MNKEKQERRFSSQELHQYRERLIKQKEFLTEILSKIEEQIAALQVERLHLRKTLLGTECTNQEISPNSSQRNNKIKTEPVMNDTNLQDLSEQQLDLSVPTSLNLFEEEIEDDEISEDERIIVKKLNLLDY
ncbi:uncharacterized protein LOC105188785 [Harpegnathos saltator]|uniref:uncharacterized protein LOC105188785 n=1 Tax=Harpegnathos saltator TaxID=610380 RepID=UPI00058F7F06|nr:uncharacterized protein LOC105188785 [Harpegnathos saltator]